MLIPTFISLLESAYISANPKHTVHALELNHNITRKNEIHTAHARTNRGRYHLLVGSGERGSHEAREAVSRGERNRGVHSARNGGRPSSLRLSAGIQRGGSLSRALAEPLAALVG